MAQRNTRPVAANRSNAAEFVQDCAMWYVAAELFYEMLEGVLFPVYGKEFWLTSKRKAPVGAPPLDYAFNWSLTENR
jgi:hypothetical protein